MAMSPPPSPAEPALLDLRGATRRWTRRELQALGSLLWQFSSVGSPSRMLRPWDSADLALVRSASWHEAVPITNPQRPHQPAR